MSIVREAEGGTEVLDVIVSVLFGGIEDVGRRVDEDEGTIEEDAPPRAPTTLVLPPRELDAPGAPPLGPVACGYPDLLFPGASDVEPG